MPPAADAPPSRPTAPRGTASRAGGSSSAPRRPAAPRARPGWARRLLRPGLALITLVLVADALVGENGWFERARESERLSVAIAERDRVRKHNAELAIRADRLKAGDPAVIEDLARGRLGMLKPGEVVFVEGSTRPSPADASPVSR
jgi:cell division protein FtsB